MTRQDFRRHVLPHLVVLSASALLTVIAKALT